MANVFLESVSSSAWFSLDRQTYLSHEYLVSELRKHLGITLPHIPCKFFQGHHEVLPGSCSLWPTRDTFVRTTIPLAGGKGGFGSMLRAIGAQIEKTTNREACRDLSGRRLRDINEEKRLKDWVSKQAEREQEREERKKKKLDKLRQEYRHAEFHDPEYFKVRSEVSDKVYEALEQGIQASSSSEPTTKKRKASDDGPAMKKTALWVGVSDEDTDSSDDESEDSKDGITKDVPAETKDTPFDSELPESSKTPPSPEETLSSPIKSEITSESEPVKEEASVLQEPVTPISEQPPASTSAVTESVTAVTKAPAEPKEFLPINLEDYDCPQALALLGLDHLKHELQRRGMKCGGTLPERASRLFSVKNVATDQIDSSLLAKPQKKK